MSIKSPVNDNFASKIYSSDIALGTFLFKVSPPPQPKDGI